MMENLLFLARRLFLCGMLSAMGMTLVKGSSQENTMRLCCACLMVITIFGALPQMKTGVDWSLPQKETMEQAAQKGLEEGHALLLGGLPDLQLHHQPAQPRPDGQPWRPAHPAP